MLQRDHQSQRMILHDVVITNEKETMQSAETTPSTTEVSETSDSLYTANILQKAISVNNYSMPENKSYSIKKQSCKAQTNCIKGWPVSTTLFLITE